MYEFKQANSNEIFEDIFENVKSPPKDPPDMRDPEVFKIHFEEKNKHLGLYYTKFIMDQYFELYDDILYRAGNYRSQDYDWDTSVETLEDLIE